MLTGPLMRAIARILPRISATERAALDAGDTWWEAELFSGNPDWRVLEDLPARPLDPEEEALLAGPIEELCRRVDPWESGRAGEIGEDADAYIAAEGLMGLRIPAEYGGKGVSSRALSDAIVRLASRNMAAAIPVMIPASVGPGELLEKYGTEAQRERWIRDLATGKQIPCFALTEPEAGSDAAATRSVGVVTRGTWEGREVLGLRLSWEKRYITLAPRATLIGLAFRCLDPEGHLGGEVDRGITCALVPAGLPGVEIGRHHDPLGVPFPNGPTSGRDVFVPLDHVIGDREGIGKGWRMLMECLAAGRAVSLPSVAAAATQMSQRVATAYAAVRRQFGQPIGAFEGVREALARIGGVNYLVDSSRRVTCAALDAGREPSVVSAIMKAYTTELMRGAVADAMDVLGGAGICRGPRNLLADAHVGSPIAVTVEGANILTRTLIVYGQGAIRCHPHVRDEVDAALGGDVAGFERALAGHLAMTAGNIWRGLVRPWIPFASLRPRPGLLGPERAAFDLLAARFALVSDVCMAGLGGALKFRQRLTGRLADALAWMYLGTVAIRRFEEDGAPPAQLPLVRWATARALHEVEAALLGVLRNLPLPGVGAALRLAFFPRGPRHHGPDDRLAEAVAAALMEGDLRVALAPDVHVPAPDRPGLGALEEAHAAVVAAADAERKLRRATRRGALAKDPSGDLLPRAVAAGVLEPGEVELIETARRLARAAIEVDVFGEVRAGASA